MFRKIGRWVSEQVHKHDRKTELVSDVDQLLAKWVEDAKQGRVKAQQMDDLHWIVTVEHGNKRRNDNDQGH